MLVELDSDVGFDQLHAAAWAASRIDGVAACIVGHSSLLLLFSGEESFEQRTGRIAAALSGSLSFDSAVASTHRIRVDVRPESAPDLTHFLEITRLSFPQFLETIRNLRLRARFLGFRGGFAYLEGLPPEWTLPRLATPRTRVAAGSFGVARGMAAFYPSESPGGWNLIGRAAEVFWDPDREPPNLISAGDSVLLTPVEEPLPMPKQSAPAKAAGESLCEVLKPGQLTLIVGETDPGRYRYGLALGGPFDVPAAAAVNEAIGNAPDAVLLECALVGPQLMFRRSCELAWSGAAAEVMVNDAPVKDASSIAVRAGDVVTIGRIQGGRAYLAFAGSILNPAPRFAVSPQMIGTELFAANEARREPAASKPGPKGSQVIEVIAGPHRADLSGITNQLWEVTPVLDRTGIRLRPQQESREQPADLPSCGTQFGTVQWHPNGELVALGPDHPITGGYLQPMTIPSTERWKLAHLNPGDRVRFQVRAAIR